MRRRRRREKGDAEEEERGRTTPVKEEEDGETTRKRRRRTGRRVAFAEGPDDVLVFDRRDPVGTDFHGLFAADDSVEDEGGELLPLDAPSDGQTTPQKFSLHEFVALVDQLERTDPLSWLFG